MQTRAGHSRKQLWRLCVLQGTENITLSIPVKNTEATQSYKERGELWGIKLKMGTRDESWDLINATRHHTSNHELITIIWIGDRSSCCRNCRKREYGTTKWGHLRQEITSNRVGYQAESVIDQEQIVDTSPIPAPSQHLAGPMSASRAPPKAAACEGVGNRLCIDNPSQSISNVT